MDKSSKWKLLLLLGWLVWAWIYWIHFLLYCFQCCVLPFLDHASCLLGVPSCRFCSSFTELLLGQSLYIFLFWYISNSLAIDQLASTFLLWKCPSSDWSILSPLFFYGCYLLLIGSFAFLFPDYNSFSESAPYYIRCPLYYNVSLISSMQSSVVSSPTLKETAPWEISLHPLMLHFILPSHSCATGPWT